MGDHRHRVGAWALVVALLWGAAASAQEEEPAEDESLDVEVSAEGGPRATASQRRLSGRELSLAPRKNAEDLLRLVPGLLVIQHGSEGKGHQIFLRGFDAVHGSDVEILLEGIPLNEWSNVHGQGYLDLGFIVPEVVAAIEVDKGSFRLSQGSFATAGSAQFRLGVPRGERGARVSYELGTTGRHRVAAVVAPGEDEATFGAVEALHDEGFGESREAQRVSAMGQAPLWRAQGRRLEALGGAYGARFGLPGALRLEDLREGDVGFYDSYIQGQEGQSLRAYGALRYRAQGEGWGASAQPWAQWRRLSLDENFTGYLREGARSDRRLQEQDGAGLGLNLSGEWRLAPALKLLGLGQWRSERIAQREARLDRAGEIYQESRSLGFWQHQASVGASARWSPTSWWLLEGGARGDLFGFQVEDRVQGGRESEGVFLQLSPRLTSSVFVGESWSLFAAAGRGFRPPEARALAGGEAPREDVVLELYTGGEPKVTVADSGELGVRWEPGEWLTVGASGFGVWIERESVFDHVSGVNLELNGTRRLGGEVELHLRPWRWLELDTDATVVDARFVGSGRSVPGAPRWLWTGRVTGLHASGLQGALHLFHLGERPLSHGAVGAPVTVFNLTGAWSVGCWRLEAQVDNVLDTRWREGEYHFASWWDQGEARSQLPVIHYIPGTPRAGRVRLSYLF